jgi:ABC-2 type transport system permease protein
VTIDSIPEMGVFIRTRVARMTDVLLPRVVVSAAAIVTAFVTGALIAWYESAVLIGPLPAGDVVAGIAYGALYLIFVVTVVAAVAGKARTVLGTVLAALVVLLALPLAGVVDEIGRWLPSHLVGALGGIPSGAPASDYLGSALVTLAAGGLGLWLAARWAAAREV